MTDPRPKTRSGFMLQRLANQGTKQIASYWGEVFPMYCVAEYPKSGGTWLGRMVADVLQLPFPQRPRLPVAMPAVIHSHWRYSSRLKRVFYLYRDGRDVMVSFYFHRMRRMMTSHAGAEDRAIYTKLLGADFNPEDAARNLPAFIEHEFLHPRSARLNWAQHINDWYNPQRRPHVAYVSYESLLRDCQGVLRAAIEHLSDEEVDDERVRMAVDRYSMARQTGRAPGEEDRKSFVRKGVAGDWMNHFTEEAARIFSRHASHALVKLGYEQTAEWCDEYVFTDGGGCTRRET